MNFNYNQEYQTLEVTTESGITQSIHVPKQYLEKLYFTIWVELQEQNTSTENQQKHG